MSVSSKRLQVSAWLVTILVSLHATEALQRVAAAEVGARPDGASLNTWPAASGLAPGGDSSAQGFEKTDSSMNHEHFGPLYNLLVAPAQGAATTLVGADGNSNDNPPAVALGAENQQYLEPGPQLEQPAPPVTPLLLPISSNNYNQRQPVLASLYIDQFGNQQLGLPGAADSLMGGPQQQQQQQQQQPQLDPTQARQYYARSPNKFFNDLHEPVLERQPERQQRFRQPQHSDSYQHDEAAADGQRHRGPPEAPPPPSRTEASEQPKVRLSNAQLSALIDELKDFNSKQSSAPPQFQATQQELEPADDASDSIDDEKDNESDPSSYQIEHTTNDSQNQQDTVEPDREQPQQQQQQQQQVAERGQIEASREGAAPDARELERFAKFLLTKEGANMRFQLGLDRDSPDDGDKEADDDERDSLLESKSRERKAKLRGGGRRSSSKLEALDKKHAEVASQMDKLIDYLTDKTGEVAHAKRKRVGKHPELLNDDEKLARRGRRNQGSETLAAPAGHQSDSDGENFAKFLIEQELRQDRADREVAAANERSSKASYTIQPKVGTPDAAEKIKEAGHERPLMHMGRLEGARVGRLQQQRKANDPGVAENLSVRKSSIGKLGQSAQSYPDGGLALRRADVAPDRRVTAKLPPEEREQLQPSRRVTRPRDQINRLAGGAVNRVRLQDGDRSGGGVGDASALMGREYPISERVGERLNKLNQNLDRYFSDGFLREAPLRDESGEPHHPVVETGQADEVDRRQGRPDDEGSHVENRRVSHRGLNDIERNQRSGRKSAQRRSRSKSSGTASWKAARDSPHARESDQSSVPSVKFSDHADEESGSADRSSSADTRNVHLEDDSRQASSRDPVDSETLESRIGAGGEGTFARGALRAKPTGGTSESRKVSANAKPSATAADGLDW